MLNNATGFRKIYIAAGYTDLRRGIDGLASIVKFNFQPDPYEKDILFLFCGRRSNRIKGLVWEGDGFLLLYKRLELGGFSWPRTKEEALEISPEQYHALMQGLEIVSRHPIPIWSRMIGRSSGRSQSNLWWLLSLRGQRRFNPQAVFPKGKRWKGSITVSIRKRP